MAAAAPQPALPKLAIEGHNVFAPVQRSIDDIPVILFDFASTKISHYSNVMKRRTRRAEIIGPATLNTIKADSIGQAIVEKAPVTCLENPQNKEVDLVTREHIKGTGGSHHIIHCTFSRERKDPTLAVQLLFDDVNGYMKARRIRRTAVWGRWEKFTDIDGAETPGFLDAETVDISGSHDLSITIGGFCCFKDIFFGLVAPVEDQKACLLAVKRAIVLFCEAFRLLSILLEIFRRMLKNEHPSQLGDLLWGRIGSWKVLSRFLIYLGKYGTRDAAEIALQLTAISRHYGLSSYEEVAAEVLVLRYSDEFLLTKQIQKTMTFKKAGMGVREPRFPFA